MPAFVRAPMVHYFSELAFSLGFSNKTITKNRQSEMREHSSNAFSPGPGSAADWRGGKLFT